MHDLRGNFFLNGKRRRGKERRKGEGKRGNEGGRRGKGGGEKGEWHREGGGNEAENTHKGNGKPKDGDRKGRKDDKEEEVPGQKTHKESAGYVSGGVHKGEIKGMGKGCKRGGGSETRKTNTTGQRTHNKESMEDAPEQRNELERKNGGGCKDCKKEKAQEQRHTQGKHGRRNGTTERIGTENMEGAARIAKRRRHWNRGHTQGKHGRCTRSHT